MYINELLDAYKKAKNYVQDKQIAHDLGISTQKMSNIRNGSRYLTETEALFLAEAIGADKETVLVYLAADKAKTYEAQQAWANIAKKYSGLGISGFSMVCAGFAVVFTSPLEPLHQCALWALMLNAIAYAYPIKCLSFEGQFNEVSRND
ncbi:hypothetical protein J8B07_06860 [Vibrio parahaemolyticus]|nr:hypothetical protein [Vibrio parahaemolyticus]MBM5379627.1 hypothetical protein [Vibrio parahaemolyticus]MCF9274311.1 hypothetical protein [Vibrio parahaemolyticus]MCF9286401.1 hypothetical protein [Vibrio parahaemolyticus]HCH2618789.1 hypothetical protein [Vibrio parahaemolyticus]